MAVAIGDVVLYNYSTFAEPDVVPVPAIIVALSEANPTTVVDLSYVTENGWTFLSGCAQGESGENNSWYERPAPAPA